MEMDYEALGKNIRKYRKFADMTQADLAIAIGCSDSHIGQIENARGIPSLATVVEIAHALNTSVDRLIYGEHHDRDDYFAHEIYKLAAQLETKDKLMALEMAKTMVGIISEHRST